MISGAAESKSGSKEQEDRHLESEYTQEAYLNFWKLNSNLFVFS